MDNNGMIDKIGTKVSNSGSVYIVQYYDFYTYRLSSEGKLSGYVSKEIPRGFDDDEQFQQIPRWIVVA